MVKLLYSALYTQPAAGGEPVVLTSASELSSFGYFQRSSVLEMMAFFGRQFSKPSQPGTRNSVKHEDFFCYIYATPHGFNAVAFADAEYPSRVAFGYLAQLGEVFMQSTGGQLPRGAALTEGCMNGAFKGTHDAMLLKFQDPAEADQLTSIMRQLDETKLVLHETIETAIERGQKIDTLIEKSNELSGSSKMFYKTARKQNQCCRLM
ncbi:hypothetical protein KFE25_013192 [Diacronema lutheri]|uniref:Uncharacterized protein n=1 Tax=Diacronema lutheri TaxID=2081491 RepID=A0A8J5XBL9_DIALT|nr:hypothetical protein KFE25_013192 [Diacronema lutheri]|mmetsp:Transcript_1197/g.3907  ORF Transcript_1197/g.3907 Transcript_1197/m.3907 type:complete len:207 (-) Transcript_1197:261-881(-)